MLGANNWLERFAYKTDNIWWIFPLAGVVAIAIGMLTVLSQSLKAAKANPVKTLEPSN
jgi:putative ABC transport system permease protein